MLIRPKKDETFIHDYYNSGSLLFAVDLKNRYQRGINAQFSGFKIAACTFVLSILDLCLTTELPTDIPTNVFTSLIENQVTWLLTYLAYQRSTYLCTYFHQPNYPSSHHSNYPNMHQSI